MAIRFETKFDRIKVLAKKYKTDRLHEPQRDALIECNGAVICLRWWGQKPYVSIMRSQEEKVKLTISNKFGDVIPISSYNRFQQVFLDIVPELRLYSKALNVYDIEFNTYDNVAAFYYLLDKIDNNKEKLANTIKKEYDK